MRDALYVLLLIAAGQGLFLAIFLSSQWRKVKHNGFLGCLFLFFSLQLLDLVLLSSGKALDYPQLVFWSAPFNLAFGPFLYLYIRGHEKGFSWKAKSWLHLIPFLLHMTYVVFIYHAHSLAYKKEFIQLFIRDRLANDGLAWELSGIAFSLLVYAQLGIYLWLSHKKIYKANDIETPHLKLLKKLWWAVMIVGLFGVVQFALLLLGIQQQPVTGYLASLLAVLYIYSGAFIVFKKPALIFPEAVKPKYQSSTLNDASTQQTLTQVTSHMEVAKPFLNHDFNLKFLAAETGLPERHISQAINELQGQNFSDFVNHYRIQEFKHRVLNGSHEHLSLLGLAMDCGFKSKSTFNTAFKRLTGQTPSAYKEQLKAGK